MSYVLLLAVMVWSLRCANARTRFVLLDFRWSRTPRRLGIDRRAAADRLWRVLQSGRRPGLLMLVASALRGDNALLATEMYYIGDFCGRHRTFVKTVVECTATKQREKGGVVDPGDARPGSALLGRTSTNHCQQIQQSRATVDM